MIKLKNLEFESGFNPDKGTCGYDMIIEAHSKEDLDVIEGLLHEDLEKAKAEARRRLELLESCRVVSESDEKGPYIVASVSYRHGNDEESSFFNHVFDDTMLKVDMTSCEQKYSFDV